MIEKSSPGCSTDTTVLFLYEHHRIIIFVQLHPHHSSFKFAACQNSFLSQFWPWVWSWSQLVDHGIQLPSCCQAKPTCNHDQLPLPCSATSHATVADSNPLGWFSLPCAVIDPDSHSQKQPTSEPGTFMRAHPLINKRLASLWNPSPVQGINSYYNTGTAVTQPIKHL